MKFKSLLLILLFISNVFASNVDIKNLTQEQLETLKEINEKIDAKILSCQNRIQENGG